jgi:hypothetical protein
MTTSPTFNEGDRVYHRQRRQFGVYAGPSWTSGESYVEFPDEENECYRITTAQLVPAAEAPKEDV